MKTKTAILYQSFYGTTKQYAILISERLRCDIFDITTMDTSRLMEYDTFIVCTSIITNKLRILPFISKHKKEFLNKRVVFLVTYMNNTPPSLNINTLLNGEIKIFYKEGCLPRSMTFMHKLHVIRNAYYYHKNTDLSIKLRYPQDKNLQPISDIVEYCIHSLHVEVPLALQ